MHLFIRYVYVYVYGCICIYICTIDLQKNMCTTVYVSATNEVNHLCNVFKKNVK